LLSKDYILGEKLSLWINKTIPVAKQFEFFFLFEAMHDLNFIACFPVAKNSIILKMNKIEFQLI